MSERSIAEIIGWVFVHTGYIERPIGHEGDFQRVPTGYWVPPDCSYSDGSPPNSDDMLAWLLSRPAFVFENTFYGPMTMWGSKHGFVVTMTDADGDDVSSDCKPTLYAALEELVRLIDNYERENPDE